MHNALVDGLWSQITQNGRYLTYLLTYLLMGSGIFRPLERPVDSRSLQPIYSVIRTDFNPHPAGVWLVTRPARGGGQRPPWDLPNYWTDFQIFKRHSIALYVNYPYKVKNLTRRSLMTSQVRSKSEFSTFFRAWWHRRVKLLSRKQSQWIGMDSVTDICKHHFLCFLTIIQVKVISGHQVKKVKQKKIRDLVLRYMFLGQIFAKNAKKCP